MPVVSELFARLAFKVDRKSGERAEETFKRIAKGATIAAGAASAFLVKSIFDATTATAELGDQTAKTAQKLGVAAGALQEMRFAAGQTGVEQRTLDLAMQRFTRRAAEAAQGTGEAKGALEELGVQLRDANGNLRPTEDLLTDVADGLKGAATDGDRLRLSFKLFDSEGAALVNTLKGGGDALNELRQEARDLGGVLDKDLLDASEKFADTQGRIAQATQGVRNIVAKAMLPLMQRWADGTVELLKGNGALAQAIGRLVTAVRRIGTFFTDVFEMATEAITPLQGKILAMTGAALLLAAAFFSPAVAIAVLSLLVLGLIDDFQTWREGGKSVIGDLMNALFGFADGGERVRDILNAAFESVADTVNSVFEFMGGVVNTFVELVADAIKGIFTGDFGGIGKNFFENIDALSSIIGIDTSDTGAALGLGQSATRQNSVSSNQTVSVNVAGTNATPEEIAGATAAAIREANDAQMRDTLDVMTVGTP